MCSGMTRPTHTGWAGTVSSVLRAFQPDPVHPALPVRLRADPGRPGALPGVGQPDPRAPGTRPTRGVEITTGPLGQGLASAVGMAMAARRERGLLDPDAEPGTSPFDHHVYVIASDGDMMEGVTPRPPPGGAPGAGQPDRGLRRQPDLHRGRHGHRRQRGRRRPVRGVRLARADRGLAAPAGTSRTSTRACAGVREARDETGRPSLIVLRHHHRLARARSRTRARRTARRSARTRSRPPRSAGLRPRR